MPVRRAIVSAILLVLAVLAGIVFAPYFIGHHLAEFWGTSVTPDKDIMHHIALMEDN